ncbi:MAG: putative secondary metabolism biosynthetic enzyme [Thelocarpon superellum]|nr:MAG: putative secondary metabolism biosynthetic enzyme [Thelocarpon superellum]
MSSSYQAIKQGGPLEVTVGPKHAPEKDEILVKNKAIALNPADYKQLQSGFRVAKWPATFGFDAAGIVEAVGPEVTRFNVGDEVLSKFSSGDDRTGAFQEFPIAQSITTARKPTALSFEDASSLPVTYLTAASAIYGELQIPLPKLEGGRKAGYTPRTVLVGGLGLPALAPITTNTRDEIKEATILATSSPPHHAHLLRLGASQAFDYHSATLVSDILSATRTATHSHGGVDAIVDAVNAVLLNPALFDTFAPGPGPPHFAEVGTGRTVKPEDVPAGVVQHLPFSEKVVSDPDGGKSLFSLLETLLQQGKWAVPVPVERGGTGFEAVGTGLHHLQTKGVSGKKLVVTL